MALKNVSQFKIYEESTKNTKYWANVATENILLATHPHAKPWVDLTDPIISYVSSAAPSLSTKRTALTDYLQGAGKTVTVTSEWVRWKLRGTGEVQMTQKENLYPGVSMVGYGDEKFNIKLDVEWCVDGDILAPDVAKDCQVIVHGLPVGDGTGFIYTVQNIDKNEDSIFPVELLEPGLNWIKIGSAYGEASRGYGSTYFTGMSYIEFESWLTDWGKSFEVTNKAHNLNLKMMAADSKGVILEQYPAQIISYMEAEFLAQAKWEREVMMYYGRSARKNVIDSTSGFYKRIGPGLLEFMEDGNNVFYNTARFSIDLFEGELQNVWFDRVPPELRNVVAFTGTGGLTLWRDAMTRKYAVSGIKSDFDTFVKGGGPTYDSKNWSGLQFPTAHFTKYNSFPFGSIEVRHWPILDSTWLNGSVLHPETNLPMSSYEFIILDTGLGQGGGSNVQLLELENSEVYAYKCGVWSPAGPINSKAGKGMFTCTGPERSYQLYAAKSFGLRMKDVTLAAHFIPTAQY